MMPLRKPVICVVGPTASGKTRLAQELALALDGEVLSADSMQIYKGMDIGTGKILPDERKVPHHGLDLVDPGEPYSAALYQDYARECMGDIDSRGKACILAGGTGLYVRAAIDDYRFAPGEQTDNPVRERYERYAEEHGALALWELLRERDPESADVLHPHNVRRVVRAFELLEEGECYARRKEMLGTLPQYAPALFIGLAVEPAVLRGRIDARVDEMIAQGLVREVEQLLAAGFRAGITAPQAIGYKEIVDALDGRCSLEEAVAAIKQATHRYAKRQRTWFRKDGRIQWVDTEKGFESTFERALSLLEPVHHGHGGEGRSR